MMTSSTVTLQPDSSSIERNKIEDNVVRSDSLSKSDIHNNLLDSKRQIVPTLAPASSQVDSKPTPDLKKSTEDQNVDYGVQWLSDAESKQIPLKEILSQMETNRRESFRPRQIKTRQEACDQLYYNVSLAYFPSTAFESSDYFFFSDPTTKDFRGGFIINKETGDISTWQRK